VGLPERVDVLLVDAEDPRVKLDEGVPVGLLVSEEVLLVEDDIPCVKLLVGVEVWLLLRVEVLVEEGETPIVKLDVGVLDGEADRVPVDDVLALAPCVTDAVGV